LVNTIIAQPEFWVRKIASLDKTRLAVCYLSTGSNLGKTINIFNWNTGGEFGKLIGHTKDVWALAKLEEEFLASASLDIKIWHWTSGRLVKNLTELGEKRTHDLLPIKNNTQIVSSGEEIDIKVWNIRNGELIKTLVGHLSWVGCLILLTNGLLASGSGDGTIGIWNLKNGILIRILTGHSGPCCEWFIRFYH
jgi:WD40 repeat protein